MLLRRIMSSSLGDGKGRECRSNKNLKQSQSLSGRYLSKYSSSVNDSPSSLATCRKASMWIGSSSARTPLKSKISARIMRNPRLTQVELGVGTGQQLAAKYAKNANGHTQNCSI